ncbi:hypothetical protein GQ53DRAFT_711446 [Thozetella sp. PMI_491]|nr:hypothetical protein GQ53DRAFT_711446 [Thozetella sp. PMI_491]
MSTSGQATFPLALSYTSFTIGIVSFVVTVLNLLALYASAIATIRSAPQEIRDALGNLRQQICEEREALRQQRREVRDRTRHHRRRSSQRSRRSHESPRHSHETASSSTLSYSEQTLALHYVTLRDLWQRFKALERPFLVHSGIRAEAIRHGDVWREEDLDDEKVQADLEKHGEVGTFADWSAIYRCDFVHRFIWWQSKADVRRLADEVQRVMLRRLAREMTQTRKMVWQLLPRGGTDGGPGPYHGGDGNGGPGPAPAVAVVRSMSRTPRLSGQSTRPRERHVSQGAATVSSFSDSDARSQHPHRAERKARRQRESSVVSEHRTSQPRTEVVVAERYRDPQRRGVTIAVAR